MQLKHLEQDTVTKWRETFGNFGSDPLSLKNQGMPFHAIT